MTYVMVDIESDGPIPGDYSMVCFGAQPSSRLILSEQMWYDRKSSVAVVTTCTSLPTTSRTGRC